MKTKIDYIGIGVKKCGTTWVNACLSDHPEICCSIPKETHFFSQKYHFGFEWYSSCFQQCSESAIRGEFSPEYLSNPEAIRRIHKDYPDKKVIVIIRNPITRLKSAWKFNYKRGAHNEKSFVNYIHNKKNRKQLIRGLYHQQLSKLYKLFPSANILVVVYEDMCTNPEQTMQKIYSHLGVDDTFKSAFLHRAVNSTNKLNVKYLWLNQLQHKTIRLVRPIFRFKLMRAILSLTQLDKVSSRLFKLNLTNESRDFNLNEHLDEETSLFLKEFYTDDTEKLGQLLSRDFYGLWFKGNAK